MRMPGYVAGHNVGGVTRPLLFTGLAAPLQFFLYISFFSSFFRHIYVYVSC